MPTHPSPIASQPAQQDARTTQNIKGALLMMLAMFIFSAVDTLAKLLSSDFHVLQIVWTRQLGLLVCVLVLLAVKGRQLFRTHYLPLQLLRGLVAIGSAVLFIMAISYVPLADAITVTFIAPFVVTIASSWLLKEQIGIYRWSAVAIGFIGTLIVLRPGLASFHPALLLALIAAILFALRQIISRYIGSHDSTMTTIVYTALIGFGVLSLPLLFVFEMPTQPKHIALMAAMAILAALGEILVIKALEVALAVAVAPIHYTILIWGSLYGYFVFGHIADFWTWLGAGVIICSGLFTLYREYLRSRAS